MGGISVWQLLIVLAIVVLLFGTKRLKSLGTDLGGAIKGFKKSISDEEASDSKTMTEAKPLEDKSRVIHGTAEKVEETKRPS
jgi:sec-independent protein translocase protein TatA